MCNRSLSPRSFGRFLNVPLCSGSSFSGCHKFAELDLLNRILCWRVTEYLNGDASACALLSSRRPNGRVQGVASLPASRVWTMPALMLTDGFRV
jgi:hypothetical protein